jgi:hypothetical protein
VFDATASILRQGKGDAPSAVENERVIIGGEILASLALCAFVGSTTDSAVFPSILLTVFASAVGIAGARAAGIAGRSIINGILEV